MTTGGGTTSQHHEADPDQGRAVLDYAASQRDGLHEVPEFHPQAEGAIDAGMPIRRLARYFADDRIAATIYFAQSMARRFDVERVGDQCIDCGDATGGSGTIVGVAWLVTPPAASFMLTTSPVPQVPLLTHHVFCDRCAALWLQWARVLVGMTTGLRWLGRAGWLGLLMSFTLGRMSPQWIVACLLGSIAAIVIGTFGGYFLRVAWWLVTPRPLRNIRQRGMRILGVAGTTTIGKLAATRAGAAQTATAAVLARADAPEVLERPDGGNILDYAAPEDVEFPLSVPEFYPAAERAIDEGAGPWDMRRLFRDPDDAAHYVAQSISRRHAADCSATDCAACSTEDATRIAKVGWNAAAIAPAWMLTNGRQPVEWRFVTHHALCSSCASAWARREARFVRAFRAMRIVVVVSLVGLIVSIGVRAIPAVEAALSPPTVLLIIGSAVVLVMAWLVGQIIRRVWRVTPPIPLRYVRRRGVWIVTLLDIDAHNGAARSAHGRAPDDRQSA